MVTNQWEPQTNFWGQLLISVRCLVIALHPLIDWQLIAHQGPVCSTTMDTNKFFFCDFIKGKCFFTEDIDCTISKTLSLKFCHFVRSSFFCRASTLSVTVEMASQVFRSCLMLYWQGKVFCNPTTTTVKSQNATNHIVLGNNIILWSTAFMRQICFLLPGEWWYRCSCVGK